VVELERTDSETMLGGTSEDWPCGQSDGVEGEESARVAIEGPEDLGEPVGDVVETTDADKEHAVCRNVGAVVMTERPESSVVNTAALPGYLQDVFTSMIASMRAGNLELAKELKESNQQMRAEVRAENEILIKRIQL
jgi:hypothetical protein